MSPPSDLEKRVREAAKCIADVHTAASTMKGDYLDTVDDIQDRILRAVEPVVEENKRFKRAMVPPTGAIDYPTMVSQLTADSAKWQAECERYKGLRGCEDCGGLFPIGALNTPTVDPNGPALCKSCIGDDLRRDRAKWQARAEALSVHADLLAGYLQNEHEVCKRLAGTVTCKDACAICNRLTRHAREAEPTTERTIKVDTSWMDNDPQPTTEGAKHGPDGYGAFARPTPEPPAVRIGHAEGCRSPHGGHCNRELCHYAAVVALVGALRGVLLPTAAADALAALDKGKP